MEGFPIIQTLAFVMVSMFVAGLALGESLGRTRERKKIYEDMKEMFK
jgi:hypothetical protein